MQTLRAQFVRWIIRANYAGSHRDCFELDWISLGADVHKANQILVQTKANNDYNSKYFHSDVHFNRYNPSVQIEEPPKVPPDRTYQKLVPTLQ